jgi:hypothetical protein
MFSRRVFGGSPDTFKVLLEFGSPRVEHYAAQTAGGGSASPQQGALVRLPVAVALLEFEFTSDESEQAILERFAQKKNSLLLEHVEESVVAQIDHVHGAAAHAASPHEGARPSPGRGAEEQHDPPLVRLQLSVTSLYPVLRCVQLSRVTSTGTASDSVLEKLLAQCDLSTVWKIKGGTTPPWAPTRLAGQCIKHHPEIPFRERERDLSGRCKGVPGVTHHST